MEQQTPTRKLVAMGVAAVVAAAGLYAAMPASAQEDGEVIPGNPTCGELAPEGVTWIEFRIEPVTSGEHTQGPLTVTLDVRDTDDGQVFDWTSNIGIDAVFAKGGPNGTLYLYDEATADTGLHAPVNQSGKFAGLSHISFCYDEEMPPPPPPPPPPTDDVTPPPPTDDVTPPPPTDDVTPTPPAPPAAPVVAQPAFTG